MRYAQFFLTMAQVIPVLLLAIILEYRRVIVPLADYPNGSTWWGKRLLDLKIVPIVAVMGMGMGCELESVMLGYSLSLPDSADMESPTPEIQIARDWIVALMVVALVMIVGLARTSSARFTKPLSKRRELNAPPVHRLPETDPAIEPASANHAPMLVAGAVVGILISFSISSMARKLRLPRR